MGLELVAPGSAAPPLSALLARLASGGLACTILMIDGALVSPRVAPPADWRETRLKTPAGTVTLKRRPDGVAVVVFGNADAPLQAAQKQIYEALLAIA